MRIEQHIVAAWAKLLSETLVKEAIAALEQMDANAMLSGDDSGLKNVWEEVCVQLQYEESIFWDTYLETMEDLLAGLVAILDKDARMALWAVTEDGWDYVYDHRDLDEGVEDVPVSDDAIVSKVKDELLIAAANYTNPNIQKFLARHEDGYDELDDDDENDENDGEEESDSGSHLEQADQPNRFFDLRPAVVEPVVFVISRQQVDRVDIESSLGFLRNLIPSDQPDHIWANKGRLSLVISGYDTDPRELYEIPEVCRYMRLLDAEWPFWLFFLNQVDESIKVVATCVASTIEVAPGAVQVDSLGLTQFLERGFAGVNFIFDTYSFPEAENEVLSKGVSQILENSMIDPDRDGYILE